MQALAFQDTQFDIVDRTGQPWLRSFQIGSALGYKNPRADMAKLYDRNADEFTDRMTALVELDTASGKQQVRIFSLRGAHLLGMLSRTKKAKEFRAWVLDVLEGITEAPAPARKRQPKALPNGLTLEQQDAIKAMVKARVEALPQAKRAKGAITCWSALKSKFGCTYKQISADQFTDAASLVARVELEGEYLGKTKDSVVEVADEDLYRVYMMICHLNAAKDAFRKELHEALLMLGSRAGGGVSEHLSEAHRQGVLLSQRYGQDMDDYQRKHRLNHYRDVA